MQVIPPGMDFSNVMKEAEDMEGLELSTAPSPRSTPPIWTDVSGAVGVLLHRLYSNLARAMLGLVGWS